MGLVLKYVQEPSASRRQYRYRRRVPDDLQSIAGKKELIATLGDSPKEALKAYPSIHAGFEEELALARKTLAAERAKRPFAELSDRERYDMLLSRLRELGVDDPEAVASDDDQSFQREMIAEGIAARYPHNDETGNPIITDKADAFLIQSLMSKAPPKPSPSLDDAVKLYLKDKVAGSAFDVKKNTQRVERVISRLKRALGKTPQVDKITRDDARKVRDHLLGLGSLTPASVRRELNIVKAIINHAITEFELGGCNNPFRKLDIAGLDEENEADKRHPFPADMLIEVRNHILSTVNPELQLIWRLLEGTGCRMAEVSGLRVDDVTIIGDTPNIRVTWHEDRRIKTKTSKRHVPLVGDALAAAVEALAAADAGPMVFSRYSDENGPTNVSKALMDRVREITDNSRLVVHSLRHNIKDRLLLAGVAELDQNIILGHSLGGVGNRTYGGEQAKLVVTTAAMKKAFGLAEERDAN